MIYLTQTRLMVESEQSVRERALSGDEIHKRLCKQLLADAPRYTLWHSRHAHHMGSVAEARRREKQILSLRALSVEQVHQTALVRYFRDHRVVGAARDQTLREFYGVVDAREAALLEHRRYQLAASTQLCAADILELIGDRRGLDVVRRYEAAYCQYFSLFCDRARSLQNGKHYLLENLLPEVRGVAERLRLEVLDSKLVPKQPIAIQGLSKGPARPAARAGVARRSKLLYPRA